ncbi:bactofilin family protein [Candidatus Palauibacter sp.]|uniref:bactofilin family protein n=1 Tax=Candidatus Palauibacter sp. TaxID=3101350 RepID=UPI003B5B3865
MARDSRHGGPTRELSDVVSVVAPGMTILGDVMCDGTVRVEGKIEGSIKATKSVVVGKDGRITGDIETQDVVVAGTVIGTVAGASRVELQETCKIEGDIRSRRVKLEEGGQIEGRLHMTGKAADEKPAASAGKGASPSIQPQKPQRAAGRS